MKSNLSIFLLGLIVEFLMVFCILKDEDVDTDGEGEGGTNGEIRFDINTLPNVK